MDFQPIEERVAAMMATGHAGTLSGRWSATKVNEPERGVIVYDRIHNQLVKHEEECLVNAAIKGQTDTSIAVRAANERHEGKLNTFRKQFGSCPTCTAGVCTQRCVK